MKIAIIGPGEMDIPPKGWGAVESLIFEYYKELSKLGHKVLIVNTKNTKKIVYEINAFEPDFVHCQYDNFIDILAEVNCPFKAITSHYGYLDQVWNSDKNYLFKVHKKIIEAKDVYIFALSESIARRYISDGTDPNRIFVIPNGVSFNKFERKDSPKYANRSIYLAKVDSRKRQGLFQNKKANIFFAGNLCKFTARKSGFDPNKPNYLGEWSKENVYQNLTDYANLVLLSDGEAHPLVCLEGLSAGLGLVISEFATANLDLSKSFIDVIPESKINDFKYVKTVIIKNREKSIKQRQEIIDYARKFDWESTVKNYLKIISTIITNKKNLDKIPQVGFLIVATGKYHDLFFREIKNSILKYFGMHNVQINLYCFSDTKAHLGGVRYFKTSHIGWPFDTLLRYKLFLDKIDNLMINDSLFYVDADMRFVNTIPLSILNENLVMLPHIGFLNYSGTFEEISRETTYVNFEKRKNYVQGCFWGGKSIDFKYMITSLAESTDRDLAKYKIPVWHDESYLNKYISETSYFLLPKNFSAMEEHKDKNTVLVHVKKNHFHARESNLDLNFFDSTKLISGLSNSELMLLYRGLYLAAHEKNQELEKILIKITFAFRVVGLPLLYIKSFFSKLPYKLILKFFYKIIIHKLKQIKKPDLESEDHLLMQDSLSVLMPVYNSEKSVASIINSVLEQSYKNFEFIIIDDGSTDRTLAILSKFKDNRIKIFTYKKNKGIVYALNYGLSKCKGAYIARVDADDYCEPSRFEKQLHFLQSNPDYGVCGTFQKHIFINSESINKTAISDNEIRTSLLFGTTMLHSTIMMRKAILDTLGKAPYNSRYRYCEDYALWVELSKVTKLHNLPEVLCHYDWREKKAWQIKNPKHETLLNEIRMKALDGIVFYNLQNKLHKFHSKLLAKYNLTFSDKLLIPFYLSYLFIACIANKKYSGFFIYKMIKGHIKNILSSSIHFCFNLLPQPVRHKIYLIRKSI